MRTYIILRIIFEWRGKVGFEEWIVFGKVLWAFCYRESEKCYTFQRVLGDYIRWTTQIISERPIFMGKCEKDKKHSEKGNKFVNKARKRDEVKKLEINRESDIYSRAKVKESGVMTGLYDMIEFSSNGKKNAEKSGREKK